jgi:hypothetical protein
MEGWTILFHELPTVLPLIARLPPRMTGSVAIRLPALPISPTA